MFTSTLEIVDLFFLFPSGLCLLFPSFLFLSTTYSFSFENFFGPSKYFCSVLLLLMHLSHPFKSQGLHSSFLSFGFALLLGMEKGIPHALVLKAYSWQFSGNLVWCWKLNPGLLCARQVPNLLYCFYGFQLF